MSCGLTIKYKVTTYFPNILKKCKYTHLNHFNKVVMILLFCKH